MSDKNINENTGSMDSLSKERLLDILQAEFEAEVADAELIRRVNKALDEKEDAENADVDAAWEHFLKLSAESEPIYDLEENDTVNISEAGAKKRKPLRKVFIAVAAVIAILVGLTVAANANGIDLWGAIVSWTSETFGFSQKYNTESANRIIPEQLEQLAEYFDQYGINREKLPTYIPEGYVQKETHIDEFAQYSVFICLLNKNDANIILRYKLYLSNVSNIEIQKDNINPDLYLIDGMEFYIASNDNKYFVTWIDGRLECFIAGADSPDEIKKIIDSIYGE